MQWTPHVRSSCEPRLTQYEGCREAAQASDIFGNAGRRGEHESSHVVVSLRVGGVVGQTKPSETDDEPGGPERHSLTRPVAPRSAWAHEDVDELGAGEGEGEIEASLALSCPSASPSSGTATPARAARPRRV